MISSDTGHFVDNLHTPGNKCPHMNLSTKHGITSGFKPCNTYKVIFVYCIPDQAIGTRKWIEKWDTWKYVY
jgi:hypothetical protein